MKKKIMMFVVSTLFIALSISTVSAAKYIVIDNDPLSSSPGTCGYSGYTYGKGSNDYNGDHRIGTPGRSQDHYTWVHKSMTYGDVSSASYRVYLHNASFTCPKAAYYVQASNGWSDTFACFINQDTAPGGWSYVIKNYRSYPDSELGAHISNGNSSGGGKLGADAFEIIVPN